MSGSVHSAVDLTAQEEKAVAIKILNPVGFKLLQVSQIGKCRTLHKGSPITLDQYHGKFPMAIENIWWIMHPVSRQYIAAFEGRYFAMTQRLPLTNI